VGDEDIEGPRQPVPQASQRNLSTCEIQT
jgi:hypothetical protein